MKKIKVLLYIILCLNFTVCNSQKVKKPHDTIKVVKNDSILCWDTVCYFEPIFPGGKIALDSFIKKNITQPNNKKDSFFITDYAIPTIVVEIFLSKEGIVDSTRIMGRLNIFFCQECDSNAIDVIKKMPSWSPAYLRGKNGSKTFTPSNTIVYIEFFNENK